MNTWDLLIGILIAASVGIAVAIIRKNRRRGGCSGCNGNCAECRIGVKSGVTDD